MIATLSLSSLLLSLSSLLLSLSLSSLNKLGLVKCTSLSGITQWIKDDDKVIESFYNNDGSRVVSGSGDRSIRVWDTITDKEGPHHDPAVNDKGLYCHCGGICSSSECYCRQRGIACVGKCNCSCGGK